MNIKNQWSITRKKKRVYATETNEMMTAWLVDIYLFIYLLFFILKRKQKAIVSIGSNERDFSVLLQISFGCH